MALKERGMRVDFRKPVKIGGLHMTVCLGNRHQTATRVRPHSWELVEAGSQGQS